MSQSAFSRIRRATRLSVIASVLFMASPSEAQAHRVSEMTAVQIASLDREKTVVLLPGGILEEHGPYLPSFADGYYNAHLTRELSEAIAARQGWSALVFPTIPLGSGGANEIGGKYAFPGTYAIRPETLRAVFMDLAMELGDQGFQWIFVLHGHGSPSHNRALDEAGDFFRDAYDGRMVHLWGLLTEPPSDELLSSWGVSERTRAENGFTVHAGLFEHSKVMALRPDLVPSSVGEARSITGKDFPSLIELASAPDWLGYFGAPRFASEELGQKLLDYETEQRVRLAMRVLDGADEREMPRYADVMNDVPGISSVLERSARRDAERKRRQQEWLAR